MNPVGWSFGSILIGVLVLSVGAVAWLAVVAAFRAPVECQVCKQLIHPKRYEGHKNLHREIDAITRRQVQR